ncbi:unnamed protein product [Nesidiocoris tenuis]|uniref:C2H2-type domain-containing protein n=1 Tax=Nesidiocoris tenuis TaxID=355587 RepID=A0A6H5GE94_9HEMI|nr:unnamed protein product [Nesidiocoris tenuis]
MDSIPKQCIQPMPKCLKGFISPTNISSYFAMPASETSDPTHRQLANITNPKKNGKLSYWRKLAGSNICSKSIIYIEILDEKKPYGCAHCGKAFADRSNLRAHMQTHSADKNYQCSRCRKTFALKSYLNKHLESACVKEEADSANVAANVAAATANVKVVFETVRNAVQVQ